MGVSQPKTSPISKYSVFFSFFKLLPGTPFFLSLSLNKQKATALIDQSRGACSWKVGQATSTAANSLGCTSKTEHFPPQNISPLKNVFFLAKHYFPWLNIFHLKKNIFLPCKTFSASKTFNWQIFSPKKTASCCKTYLSSKHFLYVLIYPCCEQFCQEPFLLWYWI